MASGAIKGITVEIGGDTTKLGKALEGVEQKSRSLSKELGDINRLLKMDPGNADLLAQKQEVLAQAIVETTNKLETLREAEKQVQAQFERGEVSEEQVRALQREIIATTSKLDKYAQAAADTADQLSKLDDADNGGIDEAGDDAKKTGDKLDDMADSADKAESSGGKLGETLKNAATVGMQALAGAVTGVITGLVASAEATREYRGEMGKLETAYTTAGHSTEAATNTYKALQGVLGETDQAVEAANHLAKLADNERDLSTWTDIATGVYATFGASLPIEGLTEAANETAKTGALTGSLADALNWAGVSEDDFQAKLDKCTTEQERQSLITETLNGLYSDAADAYRETNAEVIRANEANEAWMSSMGEIGGAMEPIITDVKMLGASLLSDLVPGVQDLAGSFRDLLNGDLSAADGIGEALSGLITNISTKALELAPALVQAGMSLITSLTTTLLGMLPQLVSTGVELLMSVISGITSAIPQITAAVVGLIPQLTSALVSATPLLIQAALDLFNGILLAIPQIVPLLIASIPQIVTALVDGLTMAIPQLIEGAIALIMGLIEAAPLLVEAIYPLIPQIITSVCNLIAEQLPVLLNAAIQLLVLLVTEIVPRIIAEIWNSIPLIWQALSDGLVQIFTSLMQWCESVMTSLGTWLSSIWQRLSGWASDLWSRFTTWISGWVTKAGEAGRNFLNKIVQFFSQLPGKVGEFLSNALSKVTTWASNFVNKAKTTASNFLSNIVQFFSQLPEKIGTWLSNAISKVVSWASDLVAKGKEAAKNLLDAVVNGVKSLPDKIKSVGKDLIMGLWNGINDKLTWLKNKISSFANSVLDSIKSFFGINSPSRVMRDEVGRYLAEGLSEGMTINTDEVEEAARMMSAPVVDITDTTREAMSGLDKMAVKARSLLTDINGASVERGLQTINIQREANNTDVITAMAEKLDRIISTVGKQQIVLDTGVLVGETLDKIDAGLAVKQQLVARGV